MSLSVAGCVKSVINRSPFISEMLIQDIISFSNLAKFIQPKVESLYGSEVNNAAIVMAIRRYADDLRKTSVLPKHDAIEYEITVRTNIYDVNFIRSEEVFDKLPELYSMIHPDSGDFLNISSGNKEVSLCVSNKYKEAVDELLVGAEIIEKMNDLVAISIEFHSGNFLQTPGVLYLAARKLAWENINVIEIISTLNILSFVVRREDSHRAYAALEAFLKDET